MPNKSEKILLCISNDISSDQRLDKVCRSLTLHGFEVELIGRKLSHSKALDRPYSCKRLSILFNKGALFYAFLNIQLFFYLMFKSFDKLVANDLDTLVACKLVSKLRNKTLVIDLHELFPEVPELVNRPKTKAIWERIEKWALSSETSSITVCQSIADYYKKKYQADVKVVRNVPKKQTLNTSEIKKKSDHFILIYQGAINYGRGVDKMIELMEFLPETFKLWIIGDGDKYDEIKDLHSKSEAKNRITLFGRKSPEELKKLTLQADLGLSLEQNIGLNYYYALPNKMFDYMQAEIPSLVSNLPEMKRFTEQHNTGYIVDNQLNTKELAKDILKIYSEPDVYQEKQKACKLAKQKVYWAKEFETYLEVLLA
ncbi:MAG: glycosyltransferase [Flavobacteriales bacterium]